MSTLITDTECFPNLWAFGARRVEDGKVLVLEHSDRRPLDCDRLERIIRANRIVTFNGLAYDMPMIWAAIRGWSVEKLKRLNDQIIVGRVRWWQVEDLLGFKMPKTDHIDLIEPQPNAIASLKTLNGRLHGRRMQDLPYSPDHLLTPAERDEVLSYLGNDLEATHLLYDAMKGPLELREALGRQYSADFRSKSDSQIGEAIIRTRVEKATGARVERAELRPGAIFRYQPPPYLSFTSPELQAVLERLRTTDFMVKADGKIDMPKWLRDTKVAIGATEYVMGIGGLHSTESARSLYSDAEHTLKDFDVGSYYPAIIIESGLYPKALGKEFLTVYRAIRDQRIAAKRAGEKVAAEGLKIALNGVFGKLGSRYSVLYAPHLLITVTLTGQLALLMLIERAEAAGVPAVSGNTDGVVFRCPKALEAALAQVTAGWERDTGFELEETRYRSLHSISVNTYFAIKEDGKAKRKGTVANPWAENDVRTLLMKNPNMTICSDAALAWIKDAVPVEQTIMSCVDIKQFVTVVNVKGGGTWRGDYLGKVVRYYWADDGEPILYKEPHPSTGNFKKVSRTDGCRPMMELPERFPEDIDYARYVAEAKTIIRDVGLEPDSPTLSEFSGWDTKLVINALVGVL